MLGGQRAFGASFRFFVAFFTVSMLGSSSSAVTGGAFASWHAVHVVFRPGSPALSNLRKAPGTGAWHGPRRGTRGVGVGSLGGAPASRARVDRLRTLATLVRVGGRVHEHAVLWMLAIRERRLARWRSRLVAAAHTRSMRGSAEREREARVGVTLCVLTSSQRRPRRALWPMWPWLSAAPRFGALRAKEEAAADVAQGIVQILNLNSLADEAKPSAVAALPGHRNIGRGSCRSAGADGWCRNARVLVSTLASLTL